MVTADQHIADSRKAAKAPAYVQDSGNGLYAAFVPNHGFTANRSLPEALAFIREATGRTSGCVPCFNEVTKEWDDELDLAEGV